MEYNLIPTLQQTTGKQMKKKLLFPVLLILITISSITAQSAKPEAADNVLKAALNQAQQTDRNVFLFFHASWCGWCKRFEKALGSEELKNIFEKNFVITFLDVLEREEKIAELENPGARDVMMKYDGEKSGLPFYAFLDKTGKKICDSNVMDKNSNIGYPGSDEEIAAFGKLLKQSAPKLSNDEYQKIISYLKANSPANQPRPQKTK